MLSRLAFLVILFALIVTSVPFGTTAKKNAADVISQDRPLQLSSTRSKRSDGKTELKLTGRYDRAGKVVELRGLTIKGARRKIASRQKLRQSSPKTQLSNISRTAVTRFAPAAGQQPAPMEGGDGPGYEYYYTQGEMTKADGTTLVNSIYQYDQAASQNVFTITLAGVTFTFDLNTYEQLNAVSDAQVQQVETWLNSEDGLLARQTGIALIQEGYQQPDNEALLIYYLIALTIDSSVEQAAIHSINIRESKSHHVTRTGVSAGEFRGTVTGPAEVAMQCSGGCGPNCYVIADRNGVPIWGGPCTSHDNCVANHGGWRLHPLCWHLLAASVGYVISRW